MGVSYRSALYIWTNVYISDIFFQINILINREKRSIIMFENEQFKIKEGELVINYFAHCIDVEELYKNEVAAVCEKYGLTYMEFTVLMFLANNPQYDTATQIVRYRHLAKSHVSISIRSLQERGLILGEHKGGNHRTIHLSVADKAKDIIADGRAAQSKFCEIIFAGFSREEVEMLQQFTEQVNRNIKEYTNS